MKQWCFVSILTLAILDFSITLDLFSIEIFIFNHTLSFAPFSIQPGTSFEWMFHSRRLFNLFDQFQYHHNERIKSLGRLEGTKDSIKRTSTKKSNIHSVFFFWKKKYFPLFISFFFLYLMNEERKRDLKDFYSSFFFFSSIVFGPYFSDSSSTHSFLLLLLMNLGLLFFFKTYYYYYY